MEGESKAGWVELGAIPMGRFGEARLQLHWAIQPVMAFADCGLETRPDDSQSNLGWRSDIASLVSRLRPEGLAAGLSLRDCSLMILDARGAVVDRIPLEGQTIDRTVSWLEHRLVARTGDTPASPIRIRDYEMPVHKVAKGGTFDVADRESFKELAGWFGAGWSALEELAARETGWAEVRCWPHHFDLGTLKALGSASIGAGFSPGDDWVPEPYFYVNPYGLEQPPADPPTLAADGHWHTEGWFGAVLPASSLLGHPADSREQAVSSFLRSAVAASMDLIHHPAEPNHR